MKKLSILLLVCLLLPCLNSCLNVDGLTPDTTMAEETTSQAPTEDAIPNINEMTEKSEDETTTNPQEETNDQPEDVDSPTDALVPYDGPYDSKIAFFDPSRLDAITVSVDSEYPIELLIWNEEVLSGSTQVIEINGTTYEGIYQSSEKIGLCFEAVAIYEAEEAIFEIGRDSKRLYAFSFKYPYNQMLSEKEPIIATEAEALEEAEKLATKYLSDLDAYTVTANFSASSDCYAFEFMRRIEGFNTSDYMQITFSKNGYLQSVRFGDINAFKGVDVKIDAEGLLQSAEGKGKTALTEAFKDHPEWNMQFRYVSHEQLIITPEGEVLMLTKVDATYDVDEVSGGVVSVSVLTDISATCTFE